MLEMCRVCDGRRGRDVGVLHFTIPRLFVHSLCSSYRHMSAFCHFPRQTAVNSVSKHEETAWLPCNLPQCSDGSLSRRGGTTHRSRVRYTLSVVCVFKARAPRGNDDQKTTSGRVISTLLRVRPRNILRLLQGTEHPNVCWRCRTDFRS